MLKNNPLIYLTKKVWQYSVGNRKNLVLYLSMFVMANATSLITPLIFAKIMNVIQEIITKKQLLDGNDLLMLFLLMLLLPIIQLVFWAFHGPARVMERKNAFIAEANYKKFLLAGTMAFPMEWHVEHHTGDTYDKILVPQYEYLNKAENKISEKVIDAMTNIATIIILRVEKQVQKAIAKKIAEPFSIYKSEC